MSTTQTTTLDASLNLIAKKSGKTLAEVKTAYDIALTTLPPSLTEKKQQSTALMIVNRDLSVNTQSTAVLYEAIILGAGKTRDLMQGIRTAALKRYSENPQGSLDSQEVKLEGETVVVLDNRKEINGTPNKKFGQPRPEHMYVREIILAAKKPGEKDFIAGRMSLWNNAVNLSLPFGKVVAFSANGELTDGEYKLRSAVGTSFEIKQELPSEEVIRIIDTTFETYNKDLGDCLAYHKSLPRGSDVFYNRLTVTEASVSFVNMSQDPAKNHRLSITASSMPEGSRLVNVWVPNELGHLIDFGRGSIITIICQTGTGKGWDSETRSQTDEEVLQLNAFSMFARPGLKTPPEEQGEII